MALRDLGSVTLGKRRVRSSFRLSYQPTTLMFLQTLDVQNALDSIISYNTRELEQADSFIRGAMCLADLGQINIPGKGRVAIS